MATFIIIYVARYNISYYVIAPRNIRSKTHVGNVFSPYNNASIAGNNILVYVEERVQL